MNIINIIVSEKGYSDRFEFFLKLDPYVKKQIIFTREYTKRNELKNTIIRTPEKPLSSIRFWLWVAKEVSKILKLSIEKWLIIEHLNGLALCLVKYNFFNKKAVKPIYILALYSENFSYLFKKAWTLDKNSPKITIKQHIYYYRNWLVRCCLEFIYILSSDAVIANGPQVLKFVNKLFSSKPTYLIKNSISLNKEFFTPTNEFLPSSIKILCVGMMMPAKGIGTLLASIKLLEKKKLKVHLTLIGRTMKQDQKWFHNLLITHKDLDIELIPHVNFENIKDYYYTCNFFVFPSFSEGSPRVILEALNYNCEVICSDLEAIRSIDPNGTVITYFTPGNAEDLSNKILLQSKIKKDPDKKKVIRHLLEAEHSHGPLAINLINFYKTLKK